MHRENALFLVPVKVALMLVAAALVLSGCGVAIGAGAAAGTASMQERGLSGAVDDKVIQTKINAAWLEYDRDMFLDVFSEVHEGRVLLTGNVAKPAHRIHAVRLAWKVDGVREVINEIEINDKTGVADFARDSWITTKLIVKLTVDKDVKAINYSIDTVNSHVFIMGVAQDEAELARVKAHARDVSHVRRITSYALLKEDPARRPKVVIPDAKENR